MTRISSLFNSYSSLPAANPGGSRELILIVDDEDSVTLLAGHVLTNGGYRVITARNGFQAIDLFKRFHADLHLVILDFVMPILSGGEVLIELLKIDPQVPVLLTSGFTSNESLKELLEKQLCGFIPKPLAQKKLMLSVRSAIDAARTAEPAAFLPAAI